MSMASMLLEIVTPERKVYSKQVDMVIARGVSGDLGILPNHIPFVTTLKIAPLRVKDGVAEDWIAVNGGFMQVAKDKVVILAESAELADDINLDRAESAKTRAESRISTKQEAIDFKRAEIALQKAINRIEVGAHRKLM
jgi:F-type H+-transporting ATPase subunit epsilon